MLENIYVRALTLSVNDVKVSTEFFYCLEETESELVSDILVCSKPRTRRDSLRNQVAVEVTFQDIDRRHSI